MFTLLRGAHVYAPSDLGRRDVLLCGDKIVRVAEHIDPVPAEGWGEARVVDLTGRILIPGLIDSHYHIVGGGGARGPASRIPDVPLSGLTRWGITTVVGCLGLDTETKSLEMLLAKAYGLEADGITAFIYNGGFTFPPATFLGSVRTDLALMDKVLGVKLALGEPRAGGMNGDELARVASDAYTGGTLGGGPGLVHIHLGRYSPRETYGIIRQAMEMSGVPADHFVLIHMNNSEGILEGGCEFAGAGTYITVDTVQTPSRGLPGTFEPDAAILRLHESGVPWERLTLATDGNSSAPAPDPSAGGWGPYRLASETLLSGVTRLAEGGKVSFARALELVTSNVARQLGLLGRKGVIQAGADADLVVLSSAFKVDRVYARGRLMVGDGQPVVLGMFELAESLE